MTLIEKDLGGDYSADRFINQFILGPVFVDGLVGWKRVPVNDRLKLTVHPGLDVEQVREAEKAITIIGYVLDPLCPEAGNADIATALMASYDGLERLIRATEGLGGRWILIATDGAQTVVFNDALGLRQVFFTTTEFRHGFWAMSQPGLLAWLLKLPVDDDAMAFFDSYEVRKYPEYRWPCAASAFSGIRRLLPNSYLDVGTAKEQRFWPTAPLGHRVLEEAVERAAGLLEGLMDAAYHRFDLVHGMTAGYDSRTVLAAARKHRACIRAITVRQGLMPDDHRDLLVPARLLEKLDIPHTVIKAMPFMSGSFSKAFKENVYLAHDHYGPDAEAILAHFSRQKVVVTGSGAEVVKSPFRERIDGRKSGYTGGDLASIQWMGGNGFAVRHFSEWLEKIGDPYDIHLLDLLAWEHLDGSWLAATLLEFDIAWRDTFTPFNCRALLGCLLSIDERYRKAPDYKVFRALVGTMWPELLDEPFNPESGTGSRQHPAPWWRRTKKMLRRRICG